MSRGGLNLASAPFVNTRPVVRLSIILWLAGVLLLAGNVWLYWDFLAGRGDVHARLREVGAAIDAEQGRIDTLQAQLEALDLEQQNEKATFLNERIARRRFSWSHLFDELADLLPGDVRLQSLSPSSQERGARERSARRTEPSEEENKVSLRIEATARNDQAILDFVDALFADPSFEQPNLMQQAQSDKGLIRFHLEVVYMPPAALGGEPAPQQATPPEDGETAPAESGPAATGERSADAPESASSRAERT